MRAALARYPTARRCLIAYSGGLDSHVLLHASWRILCAEPSDRQLCQRNPIPSNQIQHGHCPPPPAHLAGLSLAATYVDHQLQAESAQWAEHCAATCAQLDLPFHAICVDAQPEPGHSPEARARDARYAALAAQLDDGDLLLTAQHRHDQAETVLLQLLRGSGVAGLAAMPASRPLGAGTHLRPLLDIAKPQLLNYAREHQLHWIEDPSNQQPRYRRNYLRQQLWPQLSHYWPSADATLARSARHAAEASALLCDLAAIDMQRVVASDERKVICLLQLSTLSPSRQRNLLRHWLQDITGRFPGQNLLRQIETTLLPAKCDANPKIACADFELRRYRQRLYAVPAGIPVPQHWSLTWRVPSRPLAIPLLGVTLPTAILSGIDTETLNGQTLRVTLRGGGEHLQLPGRPRKSLQSLLQEYAVPPWERDRLPLIYLGEQLIAIFGLPKNGEWLLAEIS